MIDVGAKPPTERVAVARGFVSMSRATLAILRRGEAEKGDVPAAARIAGILAAKHTPDLVTWNGGGFDLPVLHYRGLRHGVVADKYWDMGEDDREFKWNNYISRYHMRHLDLMDVLAMYQPRANAPLAREILDEAGVADSDT